MSEPDYECVARDRSPFGRRIHKLRTQASIGQEELARRSHLSLGTVSSLERGDIFNPRLNTLIKLSRGLNMELHDLVRDLFQQN